MKNHIASDFVDSMLNNDNDDSGTRIEPGSVKIEGNLKRVVADTIIQECDALQAEMKYNLQDQAADPALSDVLKHDTPPEGEKRQKTSKSSKSLKSARGSSSKQPANTYHIPTIYDYARMMDTLNDVISNQFKDAEENSNEPLRNLYNKDLFFLKYENTKERSYILSLHKIHVVRFPKEDLEEKLKRWVRKEFKTFKEEAQIIEVVRITTDQQNGLDYMEQIIVKRENDKRDSFSKADFKYLNKNDIEDFYYLCLNKKLGIESYQIRVNLTAPTLTFIGIEAYDPYSIVDKPNTVLIYLNSKEEKRVMYLDEIVKFYDATLERVFKELKIKIIKYEPWKKPLMLGELDLDILKAYEREITKCLRHRVQMRS
ncbi:hypothetical protein Tco_0178584 [Tanacetum coccineum]